VPSVRRIVIADDHVPFRTGIRAALEQAGFEVVAEAGNASDAIRSTIRERPDLCVLDIKMPGGGIEAAAEIHARLPEVRIVMLTISRDDADLFEAIKAGASGYLLKDVDAEQLPLELEAVLDGEGALARGLVAQLLGEFRRRSRRGWLPLARPEGPKLTEREWEVLELLREELDTGEIAERLAISPTTVRRHIGSILRKLEVPDREAAVRALAAEDSGRGTSASR
jgi:DNA-binding NarL/FixJ family response regulator